MILSFLMMTQYSKINDHRPRQSCRREVQTKSKLISVVENQFTLPHWNGKLDVITGDDSCKIDRLRVLIYSFVSGSTKLPGASTWPLMKARLQLWQFLSFSNLDNANRF